MEDKKMKRLSLTFGFRGPAAGLVLFAAVCFLAPGPVAARTYETSGTVKVQTSHDGPSIDRTNSVSEQPYKHDCAVSVWSGSTADASYCANLAAGSIATRSYAETGFYDGFWWTAVAGTAVQFKDTIYFTVPAGTYPAGLNATLSGIIEGWIFTTDTDYEFGSTGRSCWSISSHGPITTVYNEGNILQIKDGETYSVCQPFDLTILLVPEDANLPEPTIVETTVNASIGWAISNQASVVGGYDYGLSITDFSVKFLCFDIPGAVTWTSASGVFLAIGDPGNLDGYNGVNLIDFAMFADRWLLTPCNSGNDWCGKADITVNGIVDRDDLREFVERWLEGAGP